jgi:hypothetical protein
MRRGCVSLCCGMIFLCHLCDSMKSVCTFAFSHPQAVCRCRATDLTLFEAVS